MFVLEIQETGGYEFFLEFGEYAQGEVGAVGAREVSELGECMGGLLA